MRSIVTLLLFLGALQAQQSLFDQARAKALTDSVITRDEQELLDLIQGAEPTPGEQNISDELNQEGRWRWIYTDMSVASGLYGVGIPFVLEAADPIYYLGFQLLVGGGGFLYAYNHTRELDVPMVADQGSERIE